MDLAIRDLMTMREGVSLGLRFGFFQYLKTGHIQRYVLFKFQNNHSVPLNFKPKYGKKYKRTVAAGWSMCILCTPVTCVVSCHNIVFGYADTFFLVIGL